MLTAYIIGDIVTALVGGIMVGVIGEPDQTVGAFFVAIFWPLVLGVAIAAALPALIVWIGYTIGRRIDKRIRRQK